MHRIHVANPRPSDEAIARVVGRRGRVLGVDLVFFFSRLVDARAALARVQEAYPRVRAELVPFEAGASLSSGPRRPRAEIRRT